MSGPSLRACFTAAGCTKLGHILTKSLEELSERTGVRSLRLLKQATTGILKSLHADHTFFTNDSIATDQWRKGVPYVFPSLNVTIAVGEWQDDENCLLSFETPQLMLVACMDLLQINGLIFLEFFPPLEAAGGPYTNAPLTKERETFSGGSFMGR